MNLEYKHLIPQDFADNSRVWIYQCNRKFSISEALQLEDILDDFTTNWKSHGSSVKSYANLFFGQFIVLMADETQTHVGGCSTDASTRFIAEVEKTFGVTLFDRQSLALIVKDKLQILPLTQFEYAVSNQFITEDTLYFNNLANTKKELLNNWIIPVKESWLNKRLVPSL